MVFVATKNERPAHIQQLRRGKFDVCIASYEGVTLCKEYLRLVKWQVLVLDEAHRIKNSESLLRQHLLELSTRRKLMLTGTPMQMNLKELWSLLNYLVPDLFDSLPKFEEWFSAKPDCDNSITLARVREAITPFFLRRLKADVERNLPPKKEIHITVHLTPLQKQLYRQVLRGELQLRNKLMQLRKVCNHPYLLPKVEDLSWSEEKMVKHSGKLKMLDKILPKLRENKSKVLIFSQMTRMMTILEDYCELRGYPYLLLDGMTSLDERRERMDEFNSPDSDTFIFLLSTRAGGLGINLVAADTVIIYDSDWNPQVDLQAMDRAHRIGQTKQVNVLRLITKNSLEEKMIERQLLRLTLGHMVLQKGLGVSVSEKLLSEEMKHVVQFGADLIMHSVDEDTQLPDEDLSAILERGEKQAKMLGSRVEETLREKQEQLEDFDSKTDFFTFYMESMVRDTDILHEEYTGATEEQKENTQKDSGNERQTDLPEAKARNRSPDPSVPVKKFRHSGSSSSSFTSR